MSSAMKVFIIIAVVLIVLKHPEIIGQLLRELNQIING